MSITLYGPRTGKPHQFRTRKAADVFRRKGWTEKPQSKQSSGKSTGESKDG